MLLNLVCYIHLSPVPNPQMLPYKPHCYAHPTLIANQPLELYIICE